MPHVVPAEYEEVQYSNNGQQIKRERRCNKAVDKYCGIDKSQPFYLDWNDEEQQHLHVREKRGKREEHRKIDKLRIYLIPDSRDEIQKKAIDKRKNNAGEEINGEAARTPFDLKHIAYHIVEIERDKRKETRADRDEHERDESPYLPLQDEVGIENKIIQYPRFDKLQDPYDHICYHDIAHEVFYPEIRVSVTEQINFLFHNTDNIR